MKNFIYGLCLFIMAESASAAVMCSGKITKIYKWNYMNTISVIVTTPDGKTTPWISLPSKSDESMAMMAFAADQSVAFYWNTANLTSCVDNASGSWAQNTQLDGYFIVLK